MNDAPAAATQRYALSFTTGALLAREAGVLASVTSSSVTGRRSETEQSRATSCRHAPTAQESFSSARR
jgi:hypothetical protein